MPKYSFPEVRFRSDTKLLHDIEHVGWHIVGILADGKKSAPNYAFSVGLYHTLDHPEVVIYGLEYAIAGQLINGIAKLIQGGASFLHGTFSSDLTRGSQVAFITFDREHYQSELGTAQWFYRGDNFPAVQCVWPDKSGVFPWQTNYDEQFTNLQPIWGNSST